MRGLDNKVAIGPRIARLLEAQFDHAALRRRAQEHDAEAYDVLLSLHELALSYVEAEKPRETSVADSGKPATDLKWKSTTEVAEKLGLSRQAIGKAIRAGRLPATQVDGHYRIAHEDYLQYRAAREGAA